MIFLRFVSFVILVVHIQLSGSERVYMPDQVDNNSNDLSTPEECARNCVDGEPPKRCYYSFNIEFYTVMGPACDSREQQNQCIYADGLEKTLTPINRQLPGPIIEVCKNDTIIVDVKNAAPGLEVTIHWHGIFQKGYQYYDGVPYVTQCPIPSSSTFRYEFKVQNSGTHFYHSHMSTFMLDGQYGPLIVRDTPSQERHLNLYDEDKHLVFLSDWMHELSLERVPGWYRHDIGQTAQNILINGRGNWVDPVTKKSTNASISVYEVEKGKRYRFRIINSFSTVCLAEYRIENHKCTVIAQDGANVKPITVDTVITSAGERVDCVLNAYQKQRSYWIQVRGLGECQDKKVQQLAILKYKGARETPPTPPPTYDNAPQGIVYNPLDGTKCNSPDVSKAVCINQFESLDSEDDMLRVEPDERHILDFWFYNYTQYGDRQLFSKNSYPGFFNVNDKSQLISMFNDITFETPSSPLVSDSRSYQTMCKPNQLSTCTQPCACAQVIHVQKGRLVELLIYDRIPLEGLHHPFHIHGYEFKVFAIGQFADARNISRTDINNILNEHRQRLQRGVYINPPGKDTVKIPMGGYTIVRFKADNPGWWLLHCHFTWHHLTGMELVVHVGEQSDLPPIPTNFPECSNWKPPYQSLNEFYGYDRCS
ncbi:laccase-3-like [Colletes gigas]|uniref:laccase-3-like n=1 Tax=Colletes gigas TaxID=935657 RepID=UPI001C9B59E9|nr:laccase-3-like [Colletes gigas]